MDKVILTLKFMLENGGTGKVIIRDVSSTASLIDIKALADGIIEKETIINNDTPVELIECIKSTTKDEILKLD